MVNPNKGQQMKQLEWCMIETAVDRLVKLIKKSNNKYISIYGLPRGGLVPAVMLSHKLNVPIVTSMIDTHPTMTLVVDDINDSGVTLNEFDELVTRIFDVERFDTAVLMTRKGSVFKPTFEGTIIEDKEWRVFPWEVKNAN